MGKRVLAACIDLALLAFALPIAWFLATLTVRSVFCWAGACEATSEKTMTAYAILIGLATLLVLPALYFVGFWSRAGRAATLGMRAVGVSLLRHDGMRPGIGQALLRYVVTAVWLLLVSPLVPGGALGGIALLMLPAIFDTRRRGLHDWLAGTYVARKSG